MGTVPPFPFSVSPSFFSPHFLLLTLAFYYYLFLFLYIVTLSFQLTRADDDADLAVNVGDRARR